MPDDLYERDILAWSDQQADLIRRLARGERVNDIDWDNIAEEIESVGRSEWHAVESLLVQMIRHLLKLHVSPGDPATNHWLGEIGAFQDQATRRFAPSMRQHIDVAALYASAAKNLARAHRGQPIAMPWPAICPFTLDQLLSEDPDALAAALQTP